MLFRLEKKESFQIIGLAGIESLDPLPNDTLTPLWRTFIDEYNSLLLQHYTAPLWQVAAYTPMQATQQINTIIGAEYTGVPLEGMSIQRIPEATWAIFTFHSPTGSDYVPAAYTRILTEWLPISPYQRDMTIPHLEVFPAGDPDTSTYTWEIWLPVTCRI